MRQCERRIKRKTHQYTSTELVSVDSCAPLEYLILERSNGGFENILVVTDHISRYTQQFPAKIKRP